MDKEINFKERYKMYFVLLVMFTLTCCNETEKPLLATDIRGPWYLNEWTSYHTLTFNDTTVDVDNSADTIFTLKYSIDDNLLVTTNQLGQTTVDTITWLTSDSLVITGIREITEQRSYSRTKRKWND